MFTSTTSSTLIILATLLAQRAVAHTYLIQPKNRLGFQKGFGDSIEDGTGNEGGLCHIGDGTPTCCAAAKMSSSQMTTYQRGDTVNTAWWRNNHVGGFIRYSVVPIDQSDSQDAFDDASNVISYECNQNGCDATYNGESPNNWTGGDSQGSKGWSNACKGSWKVPYHLKDGTYTMQWVWFGQGNGNSANSPFQSCLDFVIKGGDMGEQPSCPLWKGGDLSEKSDDACSYVSVDNPTYQGVCKSANACTGSYQVGVPTAIDSCNSGKQLSSYPLEMTSAPKGFPDTFTNYAATGGSSSLSSSSSDTSSNSSSNGYKKSKKGSGKCKSRGSSGAASKRMRRSHNRRSLRHGARVHS